MTDDFYPTFTADGEPLESREYPRNGAMSGFEQWVVAQPDMSRDEQDLVQKAYLAGQASANEWKRYAAECEKRENDLLVKCAELERERDQWKYTAEIRQQHLEYTIKAQAGEPCKECGGNGAGGAHEDDCSKVQVGEPCPLCHAREVLVTTEIVGRQIDDLLNPTPEPVKAQAGEPVGYHFSYTTPFGHVVWDIDYTPRPDAIECYPLVRTHPTTERRVPEDEKLRMALENCRLLAARHRKEDWALLILGFCAEGGVVGSVMR